MHQPPKRIGPFARTILGRDLYPYQELIADTILDSIINGYGYAFTCMLSRQSGKNELSAALESYLLFCMGSGTIIKAAPT
jgi:hypothetical protein